MGIPYPEHGNEIPKSNSNQEKGRNNAKYYDYYNWLVNSDPFPMELGYIVIITTCITCMGGRMMAGLKIPISNSSITTIRLFPDLHAQEV
eukprot:15365722-Ditylum_brightwellii.AAC.2